MSVEPVFKDFDGFMEFIKSKGTIISYFPESKKNLSSDFIIIGKVYKAVRPDLSEEFSYHEKLERSTIFHAYFVDVDGSVTSLSYRGILIDKEMRSCVLSIDDVIAIKAPMCFCPIREAKTVNNLDNNYWIYREVNKVVSSTVNAETSSNNIKSVVVSDEFLENNNTSRKESVTCNDNLTPMKNLLGVLNYEQTNTSPAEHCNDERSATDQSSKLKSSGLIIRIDGTIDLNSLQRANECDETQFLDNCKKSISESLNSDMELTFLAQSEKSQHPLLPTSASSERIDKNASHSYSINEDPLVDETLSTIINCKDGLSSKKIKFYSYGYFSDDSIIKLLSDRIVLGYCENGCNTVFEYAKILWVNNESTSTPHCSRCGVCQRLKVFFYCPLKMVHEDAGTIEIYFYSEDSFNYFETDPMEYALHDSTRGLFRWNIISKIPKIKRMVGYVLYKFNNVVIPLLSDIVDKQDDCST